MNLIMKILWRLEPMNGNLVKAYPKDLDQNLAVEIPQYYAYLKAKYQDTMDTPTSLTLTHSELYRVLCDDNLADVFPNVEIALRIFLTLMCTNCTAERSFSKLKYIKNPNRSSLSQERLNSLALLFINSDILRNLDFADIIKKFAYTKSRKQMFC